MFQVYSQNVVRMFFGVFSKCSKVVFLGCSKSLSTMVKITMRSLGYLIGCHIGDDVDDEDGNDIYGLGVTLTANWHRLVLMHTLAVSSLSSAND